MFIGFRGGYAGAQVSPLYLHVPTTPLSKTKQPTAVPHEGCSKHEHLLATPRASARAGRQEPSDLDYRGRSKRRDDDFDNDYERDDDDDENHDTDRYGRCMMRVRMRKPLWTANDYSNETYTTDTTLACHIYNVLDSVSCTCIL